jgi:hypothetical protein
LFADPQDGFSFEQQTQDSSFEELPELSVALSSHCGWDMLDSIVMIHGSEQCLVIATAVG